MRVKISNCEKELEGVIEAVDNLIENLGYEHARFSQLDGLGTTEQDVIVFRNSEGVEFTIGFDVSVDWFHDKSSNYIDRSNERVGIDRC